MNSHSAHSPRFADKFWSGESSWGTVRLVIILFALAVFVLVNFILYRYSTLPGLGLRYLLLPVFVLGVALFICARFVQHAYHLEWLSLALNHLFAGLFGMNYPVLEIYEGKKQVDPEEINLVDFIGGPGLVNVRPGNVLLVESLAGKARVLGAGVHFISKLEMVKEVASLEERHARIDKLSAITKDGIPVEVKDVHYRYRLLTGLEPGCDASFLLENPYLYCDEAVLRMTYNRAMMMTGIHDWHQGVNKVIESSIRDYISQHFVDQLTAPAVQGGADPRGEIYQRLWSASVQRRLHERGAELVWIDIGHFDIPDKRVAQQRVSTWQTKWIGDASVVRAYGESQRLAYQELGRAEAQAEMLMSIVHALEDVGAQVDSKQHMRKVILARIARLIDAMREQVRLPEEASQ